LGRRPRTGRPSGGNGTPWRALQGQESRSSDAGGPKILAKLAALEKPLSEIDVRQTRHLREYRSAVLENVMVSGHSCAPAAGAGSAGPVNSASIENSTESPTPMVVPGAGTPNVIPKSDRLSEPCAENPTRALGSIWGIPA